MGAPDPRKNTQGQIDFRLQRQYKCYAKQDPPPDRVKPIPFQVIVQVMTIAMAANTPSLLAFADMIVIAYFYLLRPGEYTSNPSDSTPFRLCDVGLRAEHIPLDVLHGPIPTLDQTIFATLEFTTQKNAVRGEVIGLGKSHHSSICPVLSIVRRVKHLRTHNAPPTTPLATYYHHNSWIKILPRDITSILRDAVTFLTPAALGFNPSDIEARSLRAAGAMALLCAHVDTDKIRLLGRWRSDEMFRYLHVQAEPLMRNFASKMVQGGNFVLTPNHLVPMDP